MIYFLISSLESRKRLRRLLLECQSTLMEILAGKGFVTKILQPVALNFGQSPLFSYWNFKIKSRAFVFFGIKPNFSFICINNRLDDKKSQARPYGLMLHNIV